MASGLCKPHEDLLPRAFELHSTSTSITPHRSPSLTLRYQQDERRHRQGPEAARGGGSVARAAATSRSILGSYRRQQRSICSHPRNLSPPLHSTLSPLITADEPKRISSPTISNQIADRSLQRQRSRAIRRLERDPWRLRRHQQWLRRRLRLPPQGAHHL